MRKIYYLKTCDTCKRILSQVPLNGILLQEIKNEPITLSQLEEMHHMAGNYEALFSKRAKLYQEMDLKNQKLSETDYKQLILRTLYLLKTSRGNY